MPKVKDIIHGYEVVKRFTKAVYLVRKLTSNEEFVLKIVEKDPNQILNDEVKIGMSLGSKCPYLVKMIEIFNDEEDLNMIIEYCEGGDLSNRIRNEGKPDEGEICRFVYESGIAIKTLHESNIIHRDIKGSNFFLTKNGGFKLGDYGVSYVIDLTSTKTMTHVGSEGYISPEIMNGERKYTNKVDIYSWGITLIEFILCGRHPFSNPDGIFNTSLAMKGTPISLVTQHPSPFIQLALQMISLNPMSRPSAADVCDILLVTPLYRAHTESLDLLAKVSRAKAERDLVRTESMAMVGKEEKKYPSAKEMREENATLKSDYMDLIYEYATAEEEKEELKMEKEHAEREKKALTETHERLRVERANAHTELAGLEKKKASLRKESELAMEELAALERESRALEEKWGSVQRENLTVKKEKEELEREGESVKKENVVLKQTDFKRDFY